MDETTSEEESSVEPIAPAAPPLFAMGTTKFDFDNDGKADASRWQSSSGEWKIKNSANGSFDTLSLGTGTAAAPPITTATASLIAPYSLIMRGLGQSNTVQTDKIRPSAPSLSRAIKSFQAITSATTRRTLEFFDRRTAPGM